jgi:hypothetical protein
MAKANSEDKFVPVFLRHAKCGGEYQAHAEAEVVPDGEDCVICKEVRAKYRESHGLVNSTTYGTPLADELGLVVTVDKIGPVAS